MKQRQFEAAHTAEWQAFADVLDRAPASTAAGAQSEFLRRYRLICRDLALAQERGYGPRLIDRLNLLAIKGHNVLYTRRSGFGAALRTFLLRDFARRVRADWRYVLVAGLLFVLPGALMAIAIGFEPTAVYFVLPPEQAREYEQMYAPGQSLVGSGRDAGDDFMMFGHYIRHNIGIDFQCFASGVAVGIGPIFYLVFNGLSIGSVAAHLAVQGYGTQFFPFVIGHGAFELPAIVLSGAAGLKLGYALLGPGRRRRNDALVFYGREAITLMYGVFLMSLIAAFLEAFWSARALLPGWTRYSVGAVLWLLVFVYFSFAGRKVLR